MKMTSRRSRPRPHQQKTEQAEQKAFFSNATETGIQTKEEDAFFQAKLSIGQPSDKYEKEADAMADTVVNGSNNHPAIQQKKAENIQRVSSGTAEERMKEDKIIQEKPEEVQMVEEKEEPVQMMEQEEEGVQKMENKEEVQMMEEEEIQTKNDPAQSSKASNQVSAKIQQQKGKGKSLPDPTRAEMEKSFGADFSDVNIHTDREAVEMNKELGAQAFATGKDIYFNSGKYRPETNSGKHLLAHELTHVVQQNTQINKKGKENSLSKVQSQQNIIQPSFCTPYTSYWSALAAESYLTTTLLPSSATMFGSEVSNLWRRYLSRSPGDSLKPATFKEGSSSIAYAFKHSEIIKSRQDILLGKVMNNLSALPPLAANTWTDVPVSTFLSTGDLNYNINFSNPFDTPGHIAGGVSGSAAGSDLRRVGGHASFYRMTNSDGETEKLILRPHFKFYVKDAVDFCPGGAGTGLEQMLTIPLSRLEMTGWAYDVPFEVFFEGPNDQKEVTGMSLVKQFPTKEDEAQRRERVREPRRERNDESTRRRQGTRRDSRRRDF